MKRRTIIQLSIVAILLTCGACLCAILVKEPLILFGLIIPFVLILFIAFSGRAKIPAEEEEASVPQTPIERTEPESVLIIGTGIASLRLLKEIQSDPSCGYQVIGLVDDTGLRGRNTINGMSVCGTLSDLPLTVNGTGAKRILIPKLPTEKEKRDTLLHLCYSTGATVMTVPELRPDPNAPMLADLHEVRERKEKQ